MKIALIGYGKMGHAIERVAVSRGHEITARVDVGSADTIDSDGVRGADVAIEFTAPDAAFDNLTQLIDEGVPTVSGTTGWHSRLAEMRRKVEDTPEAKLFWASNYSIGVNVLFELSRRVARVMNLFPQYEPSIHEVHHVHKLDHPSGTAVSLAQDIVARTERIGEWSEEYRPGTLAVSHQRVGETPGTHTVTWDSPVDSLQLIHTSKSRDALALGAVIAAEWLAKAPAGFHGMEALMQDVVRGLSEEG